MILAIDVGSLSIRCTLFAHSGDLVATSIRRLDLATPTPDWHELDASQVWAVLLDALAELDQQHDLGQVTAAGLTNRRGTCLLWDQATGEPIGPAIFWLDRRTEPFIAALRESGHALLVQVTTGVGLHSFYSAPKLRWMIDNLPGAGGLLAVGQLAGGTLDSWLLWQLSGGKVYATDYSNAQRTLLLNLATLTWDHELARLFSVPLDVLPEVTTGVRAWGTINIPALPHLQAPIGAIAADQAAALFGHGALAPGAAKCSYGTSIIPLMFCGQQPVGAPEGLAALAYGADGTPAYAIGCTIAGGTPVLEWCCNKLGMFASVEELVAHAAMAPPDDEIIFVPAFTGLTIPARDPAARAAILGLHPTADRRSIARAALESNAFLVTDALALMREISAVAPARLYADGGLARSDLLMQSQVDLLGIPVERPAHSALTSLGIAYLAAYGAGVALGEAFLERGRGPSRVFMPQIDALARQQHMARWRAGLERASGWARNG